MWRLFTALATVGFMGFGLVIHEVTPLSHASPIYSDSESFKDNEYHRAGSFSEEDYAQRLEKMGISLHPGTDYASNSKATKSSLNHCKSLVYKTLKSLPKEPVSKLKNLTLYFNNDGRRGLGGGDTIILRCQNVTDEELVSVLVHEMGHIMDTGVMGGKPLLGVASPFRDGSRVVPLNDPSVIFYKYSFTDESTLRSDAIDLDFVSGYAMSDPFEDFAESYAYYILHGTEFRQLAQRNIVLRKKYTFLRDKVFHGIEYFNGDMSQKVSPTERHYDVTVLSYDMSKFFNHLI